MGFACFREMAADLHATDPAGAAAGSGALALAGPPAPVPEVLGEGQKAGKRTKKAGEDSADAENL